MNGTLRDIGAAIGARAVTPADTDLPYGVCRGIMVGVDGDVDITFEDGSRCVMPGLTAGNVYPFRARKVHAGGTTATGVVAVY